MLIEDKARMGSTQKLNKRALAGLDWLASQIHQFEAGGQIEAPIQIS
jgi:hypothetical protein